MMGPHHNKREKLASLLFDLVKYIFTVSGVGAILPESTTTLVQLSWGLPEDEPFYFLPSSSRLRTRSTRMDVIIL